MIIRSEATTNHSNTFFYFQLVKEEFFQILNFVTWWGLILRTKWDLWNFEEEEKKRGETISVPNTILKDEKKKSHSMILITFQTDLYRVTRNSESTIWYEFDQC